MKASPQRFADLQLAARTAEDVRQDYRQSLNWQYQSYAYAPTGKRHKLEVLDRAADRASKRFYAYLAAISPRPWDRGIPCAWLIEGLSFKDAITREGLSVVPPAAYGWDTRDPVFQVLIGPIMG